MHAFPELAYGGPYMARAVIAHDNEWVAIYHRDDSKTKDWQSDV